METGRLPFIDWMKAVGMALIVWGHVAAGTVIPFTPPFNLKQLGVVWFVFVTGFTLATERRASRLVIFNRFFDVLFYAAIAAGIMSLVSWFRVHDLAESNYLPLVGLNVVQNAFPANPTTWYVGTYLHLLIVWALLLRGRRITGTVFAMGWLIETVITAAALIYLGAFIAYMLFPNWIGALILGTWFGQHRDRRPAWLLAPVFIIAWPLLVGLVGWKATDAAFPFMEPTGLSALHTALLVSACITVAYACYGLAGYAVFVRLPDNRIVRFFARNTLVVFIIHMPVYYGLQPILPPTLAYPLRVCLEFTICFVGLSIVSEGVRRVIPTAWIRSRLRDALFGGALPTQQQHS